MYGREKQPAFVADLEFVLAELARLRGVASPSEPGLAAIRERLRALPPIEPQSPPQPIGDRT